jgi:hypothetical protein
VSRRTRKEILDELARVGHEHSDATVLFHTGIASLLGLLHPTDYKVLSSLERVGPLRAGEIAAARDTRPPSGRNRQAHERVDFAGSRSTLT